MKFHFRMERILKIFSMRETVKKRELAMVLRNLKALEDKKDELKKTTLELLGRSTENFNRGLGEFFEQKIQLNEVESKQLLEEVQKEQENVEEKRYELLQIQNKRMGLEALRDRKRSEWKRLENRTEQKRLDESYQHSRMRRGEG